MVLDDLLKTLQEIRHDGGHGNLQVVDEKGNAIDAVELQDDQFDDDAPKQIKLKVAANAYR